MSDIIKTMLDYVPKEICEIVGCEKENAIEYIDQLESDAELGRAIRYLASNHIAIPMQYMPDYITDETIEYIVKTAKKVVEQC
jgi:hypothetical protein